MYLCRFRIWSKIHHTTTLDLILDPYLKVTFDLFLGFLVENLLLLFLLPALFPCWAEVATFILAQFAHLKRYNFLQNKWSIKILKEFAFSGLLKHQNWSRITCFIADQSYQSWNRKLVASAQKSKHLLTYYIPWSKNRKKQVKCTSEMASKLTFKLSLRLIFLYIWILET